MARKRIDMDGEFWPARAATLIDGGGQFWGRWSLNYGFGSDAQFPILARLVTEMA
jgi:hypothetical protein